MIMSPAVSAPHSQGMPQSSRDGGRLTPWGSPANNAGMARKLPALDPSRAPPFHALPASVCDRCGDFGCGLHQAGSLTEAGRACACGGFQRHRALWRFDWCPRCGSPGCDTCRWRGIIATPIDV